MGGLGKHGLASLGREVSPLVKQVAPERNEPMRSLLEEALRRFLDDYSRSQPRQPFRITTFGGDGMVEGMTPQRALELANDRGGWDEIGDR